MSFQNNIFYQKAKDHSVSKEIFDLHHNPEFDFLITFPKPSLEKLPSYYGDAAFWAVLLARIPPRTDVYRQRRRGVD